MNRKLTLMAALLAFCPGIGSSEDLALRQEVKSTRARLGEVKNEASFHKLIDSAADAYASIAKGPRGEVSALTLKNARCIAVLPSVVNGALVVGGTHGTGLASCKGDNGRWSEPAPVSMSQGSIGLQAGAKSADLVLYFQSPESVAALKRGKFVFGADIGSVAGSYDSNIDTGKAGVLVFTRSEGLFAGAAINGSAFGSDKTNLRSFYGDSVEHTALLEGRYTPDSSEYTGRLTRLFPVTN